MTFQNYPFLFNFAGIPSPLHQQQITPQNNNLSNTPHHSQQSSTRRNLRSRHAPIDYYNLHNYGRQGPGAWMPFDGGGNNPSVHDQEGEEEESGEQGGASN